LFDSVTSPNTSLGIVLLFLFDVPRGDAVLSSVTPDDYASESEAQLAAEKIIRKL
jgi:hypothetical protein